MIYLNCVDKSYWSSTGPSILKASIPEAEITFGALHTGIHDDLRHACHSSSFRSLSLQWWREITLIYGNGSLVAALSWNFLCWIPPKTWIEHACVASAAHPIFGGSSNPSWAKFHTNPTHSWRDQWNLTQTLPENVEWDWSMNQDLNLKVPSTCTNHTVSLAQLPTNGDHGAAAKNGHEPTSRFEPRGSKVQLAPFRCENTFSILFHYSHDRFAEAVTSDTLLTCCSTFRCCSLAPGHLPRMTWGKDAPTKSLPASSPFIRTSLTSQWEKSQRISQGSHRSQKKLRFDPGPVSVAEEFAAEVADVFEHRPPKVCRNNIDSRGVDFVSKKSSSQLLYQTPWIHRMLKSPSSEFPAPMSWTWQSLEKDSCWDGSIGKLALETNDPNDTNDSQLRESDHLLLLISSCQLTHIERINFAIDCERIWMWLVCHTRNRKVTWHTEHDILNFLPHKKVVLLFPNS